jgi:hypothetical protein
MNSLRITPKLPKGEEVNLPKTGILCVQKHDQLYALGTSNGRVVLANGLKSLALPPHKNGGVRSLAFSQFISLSIILNRPI